MLVIPPIREIRIHDLHINEARKRIRENKLKESNSLDLSYLRLKEIPTEIADLTHLKVLNLDHNNLDEIPNNILFLSNLQVLSLNNNNIKDIPDNIGLLSNLVSLEIQENRISSVKKSIVNLKNLAFLDLSSNRIIQLDRLIGGLLDLKELRLSFNKLISIPTELQYLTSLEVLDLEYNEILEIDEGIGELVNLTQLNINGNNLESIPESIANLTNLITFTFDDNKMDIGKEITSLSIGETLNALKKWKHASIEGSLNQISEAKVIFIGESNYGKTHLIELLRKGTVNRQIMTTHGIERNRIDIDGIRLNVWDLGGQEFMRSTHQFFFTERTLYVLVTLARKERNELNHWLNMVNQLGAKAPVLVVINKIDLDSHDIDRRSLERDYPNIVGFVRTSINDCADSRSLDTINELKKKISSIVSSKELMPGVFDKRPSEWFKIKKELEKLEQNGNDFITYDEYEKLDFVKTLSEDDRRINLKLLNMLGTIVSFVDDPRLADTNVINPQWIMNGVYAIINDKVIKDINKGQFHISELSNILSAKKFPKSRHAYLLQLMEKFNLCYSTNADKDTYYVPELFEDIEPDVEWNQDNIMRFRYNYDEYSPDTFVTKFIVSVHEQIMDMNRWRSGVYITNGTCSAKIYQSYRKNYINIEISGDPVEYRSYLYSIRNIFSTLHASCNDIDIREEVQYKNIWLDYKILTQFEKKDRPFYSTKLDEDIPVTHILNGYSSSFERQDKLKVQKVFLASSNEMMDHREKFSKFIRKENDKLIEDGYYIKLTMWEYDFNKMSKTRIQDEYNREAKDADIFLCLIRSQVGKGTAEELNNVFDNYKKHGKPKIYVYFHDTQVDVKDLDVKGIRRKEKLEKMLDELGHYKTEYTNIEELFHNFVDEIKYT